MNQQRLDDRIITLRYRLDRIDELLFSTSDSGTQRILRAERAYVDEMISVYQMQDKGSIGSRSRFSRWLHMTKRILAER